MSKKENKELGGFKLLAIRPMKGCSPKFKKKLKDGVIYKFFSDHKFIDIYGLEITEELDNLNETVHEIDNKFEHSDLFEFDETIGVNLSAIVGKNGSGKSTLLELFFLAIYLIDYKNILVHKKLKEDQFLVVNKENSFNEILKENEKYLNGIGNTEREHRFFRGLIEFNIDQLKLEIYYNHANHIFRLTIDTNLKDEQNWYTIDKLGDQGFKPFEIQDQLPFYSVALDYSIHSLNSVDMGIWLESIFHKNDGYQTPLVINPKRDEGSIDIENEKELQKSRLLVNTIDILSSENNADPLFNGKQITKVVFKYKFYNRNTFIRGADFLHLDVPLINAPFENLNQESKYRIEKIQEIFQIKKYTDCSWIEKEVYGYLTYKSEE